MNRKTLIVIIAILAVILIAGLIFVFTMPDPTAQDDQAGTADNAATVQQETAGDTAQEQQTQEQQGEEQTADQQTGEDVEAVVTVPDETVPDETQEATEQTVPEETEPEGPIFPDAPDVEVPDDDEIGYMDYHQMSADEQKAFINSFESYDAFFEWLDAAKEEYENEMIEIDGSTPVDAGDLVGGN